MSVIPSSHTNREEASTKSCEDDERDVVRCDVEGDDSENVGENVSESDPGVPAHDEGDVGQVEDGFPAPGVTELPKHQGVHDHPHVESCQDARTKFLLK